MAHPHTTQPAEGTAVPEASVYSVAQLNREARLLIENGFPAIWVEGELSNLARPKSGHWYFSLKYERSQVRCAMFRQRNMLVRFQPEEGTRIRVRARVSLYEARGEFQLIVETLEPAGEGALRRAFEALKAKLEAEGLFAPERKRELPRFPRQVGVITSGTGAAIRDVIHVVRRRFRGLPVVVYPTAVQGSAAPGELVEAISAAGRRAECDVLLIVRGGGSLEDLQAFNDEAVARALHACPIPTVSGVGHEVDVTIVDFVADRRAPTPSAAAEVVTPDRAALGPALRQSAARLARAQANRLNRLSQRLTELRGRLGRTHPERRITQLAQRLDELDARTRRAMPALIAARRSRLDTLSARLRARTPAQRIAWLRQRVTHTRQRLDAAARTTVESRQRRFQQATRGLSALSPLATLDRGYALALSVPEGRVITDAGRVGTGEEIDVRLARGELRCEVRSRREATGREPER